MVQLRRARCARSATGSPSRSTSRARSGYAATPRRRGRSTCPSRRTATASGPASAGLDHVAPVDEVTWVADDGIRYLRPEITLHFKARFQRPKDERDLDGRVAAADRGPAGLAARGHHGHRGAGPPWLPLAGLRTVDVKVVIAGRTGQVGGLLRRALNAAGHEVVVLSRHPRAPLEPGVRHVGWDGRTLGSWVARGRWGGRRRQPGRPLGQLPLHRHQPAADDGLAGRLGAGHRVRDPGRESAARHLAADEHRHHLRRPLRRTRQPGQRRGDRRDRRRGVPHAALLGVQRPDRPTLGGGAGGGRPAVHPTGRAAHRDGDDPGPRWRLRRAAPADAARARRTGRRRSAVRLLDPRCRLRRCGDLPAGATTWRGRSTSPLPNPFRRPS